MTAARLKEIRKALVALGGALGEALSLGVLHGTVQSVAVVVLGALTALGVYHAPNATRT
jgi:hypothetical protein